MRKRSKPAKKSAGKRTIVRRSLTSDFKGGAFPIVGVGASAGGYEAFSELLKALPERTGMAIVFVQHLDPTHSSILSEILSRVTKTPVVEVTDGIQVRPDHIYVIPANTTLVLRGGELRLGARTLIRGQHLPIDQFFESLAEVRNTQAIGVILSGTASDGTEGCRAIKTGGGITFAQDEVSAKFSSMPHSAVIAGCVDLVMPPREIARELARIAKHPFVARKKLNDEEGRSGTKELNELLNLVRERSGVDFGLYKQTTLQRRIRRRIVVHRLENIREYLSYLHQNPTELDELYRDILINVTGFFRDAAAYDALKNRVFPALLRARRIEDTPIRIWIPGCSSGGEAYSIAICVLEFLWEKASSSPETTIATNGVQIFATDISEPALDRARTGFYTDSAMAGVSSARLSRFLVRLDGGYQINKSIREMCVFARQDITKDPPFSNIDLITCRNLLIYLGPELQKRVIPTLHYALKPGGYLMLGGAESLGTFSDHFLLIDKKQKIYQKKRSATRLITYFTGPIHAFRKIEPSRIPPIPANALTVDKEIERLLVNRFVPASIVVNDQMEIVQFRGHTGAYLEPAPGHPTFSVSKMAREGLLVDLRAALSKAQKSNVTTRAERVSVKSNGHTREVDLEVIPVRTQQNAERFYVVVFQEPRKSLLEQTERLKREIKSRGRSAVNRETERLRREVKSQGRTVLSRENERLTKEVEQLREQLKSLIEEHETMTEEFKSANEEILSSNEELQSTNEELETAKEELQSSNEELTTLNEELKNRNNEIGLANNDLMNLLGNVNIPVVMVGNDLRIRRFTPPAQKLLNLIPADIGRRLGEIRPNLEIDDIEESVQATIESSTLTEKEVHEKDGCWFLMRIRPYKTQDNKLDGAVVSFQDIDDFKRNMNAARNYADALIENAREGIVIVDPDLRVSTANRAFSRIFGLTREQSQGKTLDEIASGRWGSAGLQESLQQVLYRDIRLDNFRVELEHSSLGKRALLINARRIEPTSGQQMILLSIEDVTEQKRHLEDLQTHAALLELASDAVFVRDLPGIVHLWNHGAERMYGWSRSEAIGRPVSELLKTKFPMPFAEIRRSLVRDGYWEGELVHTRKEGEQRIVASRWSLHKEGDPPTVLELNTDITERKRTEDQLRKLTVQLMQAQDEERRRIARDLHDSTGQKLAALKMSLERGDAVDGKVDDVKLLDEALQEIRTVAQLLHPPLIEEAGLVTAMRWLVDGFSNRAGIRVTLKAARNFARMQPDVEIVLYRIVQEALNNILRHSGAKAANVEIARRDGFVFLQIADDGHGMPASDRKERSRGTNKKTSQSDHFPPSPGVGLLGMKERLTVIGGSLAIHSRSTGTTIDAVIPLTAAKAKR